MHNGSSTWHVIKIKQIKAYLARLRNEIGITLKLEIDGITCWPFS